MFLICLLGCFLKQFGLSTLVMVASRVFAFFSFLDGAEAVFQIVIDVADDLFFGHWSRHILLIYYRFRFFNLIEFQKTT